MRLDQVAGCCAVPVVSVPELVLGGVVPGEVLGIAGVGALSAVAAGAGEGSAEGVEGVEAVELSEEALGSETDSLFAAVERVLRDDRCDVALAGALGSAATLAVAGSGAGTAAAGVPASATTVDFDSDDAAALVSVAGVETPADARFVVAAGTIATGFDETSWLNRNAPAITIAMITPKAIGKCFTEASCWG